jgi:hypothetical protein
VNRQNSAYYESPWIKSSRPEARAIARFQKASSSRGQIHKVPQQDVKSLHVIGGEVLANNQKKINYA